MKAAVRAQSSSVGPFCTRRQWRPTVDLASAIPDPESSREPPGVLARQFATTYDVRPREIQASRGSLPVDADFTKPLRRSRTDSSWTSRSLHSCFRPPPVTFARICCKTLGPPARRPGHSTCPSLALDLQRWTRMKLAPLFLSFVMSALFLLPLGRARADDSRCFEFVSPTAEQVFRASGAQRLLIALRFSGVDGQLAATALSRAAGRHGIETRMIRSPERTSVRDLAVRESKANQAQMVAIVEISTGPEPKTATVEFWDSSGQELAVLQSLARNGEGCRAAEVEVAQPRRAGSAETLAQENTAEPKVAGLAKHRVAADIGVFSAVGFLGATYTYSPVPAIQFELGTGLGLSGIQLSIMPKVLVGSKSHYLVVGAGPSEGITPSNQDQHTYVSYWLNGDVGYEYRSPGGFSFLFALGFTYALGGEVRSTCLFDCKGDTRGWSSPARGAFPQGRIAFGRWF